MSSDTCFDFIISTVGKEEIAKSREGGKKIKEKVKKRGEKRQRPEPLLMEEVCKEKRIHIVSHSQKRKKINPG